MTSIESAYRNLGFRDYGIRLQYGLLARQASLAEHSTFMNMGYWKGAPNTLDEAASALVRLVAQAAELAPGQRVLDVGCGFGDQDVLWMREFSPDRIDAVNITKSQLKIASTRMAKEGLADRVKLWAASATALPFGENSFDRVICVESAHHFNTRERFLQESFRVLAPGGRLVTAEILPNPGATDEDIKHLHMNAANVYSRDAYTEKLEAIGFSAVAVRSIREDVCVPFAAYLRRRVSEPGPWRKMNPVLRWLMRRHVRSIGNFESLDFVIATAVRP